MPKIYIVEDDAALRYELCRLLELQGFSCLVCEDFSRASSEALAESPDCIVLDLGLPEADGLFVCREIRQKSAIPILVLTSADSEFNEVMCMNLGADDFMAKPYRPAVLVARIQALLRRSGSGTAHPVLHHDGVSLDMANGMLSHNGRQTELTRNEQRILSVLLSSPGTVVTRQELMCDLWESDAFVDDNTLTVNVNRVRKALQAVGAPEGFIVTKRGVGYMVQA